MLLGEFVVHAWDLARGTARPWHCQAEVAEVAYTLTHRNGRAGTPDGHRSRVRVPDAAPALDRLLGLSGPDPAGTLAPRALPDVNIRDPPGGSATDP
jgi:hypothetical protein